MAITKKDANAKYDKLRKQLKIGAIDKETFKRSANAIYKKYHSKANTATRNAPTSKPKATKPQQSKPRASQPNPAATPKSQASDKAVKGGYTISPENRQPKASKRPRRRGSGVRNGRDRFNDQMKIVKKALSGLTYKKGDTKKVNGITYVHNGKKFVRYTM